MKADLKRWRFQSGDRTLYVYAASRDAAIITAAKADYDPIGLVLDVEPWITSVFEGRITPGA